ncbi:unnamed protein product [Microthlaspi erraticum]|uniref:Exonuclease domain-containing protein n=1 Tax=Microthlaspi erraticum TaxID=1685480 RepID=A0A6D2IAD3_9BRAS|nr:unnamed protein product [Microthlaspi erraticum]
MIIAFLDFKKHASSYELGVRLIATDWLVEIASISVVIRPSEEDLALDHGCGDRTAPTFSDLSDRICGLLLGQVWMGHDIDRIDIPNLIAEFEKIGEEPATYTSSSNQYSLLHIFRDGGSRAYGSIESCRRNLEAIILCRSLMSRLEPDKMSNSDDDNDFVSLISLIKSYDDEAQAASSLSIITWSKLEIVRYL